MSRLALLAFPSWSLHGPPHSDPTRTRLSSEIWGSSESLPLILLDKRGGEKEKVKTVPGLVTQHLYTVKLWTVNTAFAPFIFSAFPVRTHLHILFQPALSHSMSTMSGKNSPEGEEGAGRMKSESWGQSNAMGEVRRGQVILAAYLIVTLDLTFLFMQFGVIPYLAKNLGLDSVGFGYLQTIFGVLQLVGGPVFGRFADQFGNRAALTLSCASASAFFLLLSISTSIPILFLSRLPSVFMHGLPGAQKVITDLTAPSERAAALGRLGLCFGVGVIIGSALGGIISTKFGVFVPMYLGLVGSLINTVISIVWIPSPAKPKSEQRKTEDSSVFNVREILRVMKFPGVMEVFLVKVLSGLPIGLFLVMFSIISIEFFGLEAVESGYLMSYFGVLQMNTFQPGTPSLPGTSKEVRLQSKHHPCD
ncbi:solute carrier family 22 member 18 isoform X4 [Lagopus muta]|uniref:solute carrier family 22 member 18 isoform X4 n=1 Tax=Lagopus muta TaxID=64668 RepID=UPI00209DA1EE|nr:solute carrier family 22 member 18 isoform X4 [Lagopus muta]